MSGFPRSNRLVPESLREAALKLIRSRYADFGPTLAHEKLVELHGFTVSAQTLRNWMVADGAWSTRRDRAKRVQQPRYRRACLGELVQIDGSDHEWFEDRAPRCTLLVFIDDATGRLMELRFARSESTFDYFEATHSYLQRHGKPVAFYSDRASIFRVNAKDPKAGDGFTQFGRAMHDLMRVGAATRHNLTRPPVRDTDEFVVSRRHKRCFSRTHDLCKSLGRLVPHRSLVCSPRRRLQRR